MAFEKYPGFQISRSNAPEKTMPAFDVTPLLEEDKAVEGMDYPFRFGKSFDVNLGLKDGKWVQTDSMNFWNLKISSPKAYSLNFIFSELYLPEGAELHVFNEDGSMVYGPVTGKQNQHGRTYLTYII
jgi:lysyl endopeptidase